MVLREYGAGGRIKDVGVVNLLYGSGTGLRAKGDQIWHQKRTDVSDDAEAGDGFGSALP